MEDQVSSEKRIFIAFLYELQKSLVHIANQASLLQEESIDDQKALIVHDAEQTLATIENLLVSLRNGPVVVTAFDIRRLTQTVIQDLKDRIEEKSISIRIRSASKVAHAVTDHTLATSAVRNLLEHAIRVSPEKGTVSISIRSTENHLSLLVRDEGPLLTKQGVERVYNSLGDILYPISDTLGFSGMNVFIAHELSKKMSAQLEYNASRDSNCMILHIPTNEQLRLF